MPAAMTALVHKTITYIEDLFRGNTGGHDAAHSIRVYRNAMRIAETEPEADKEIVALAALLHLGCADPFSLSVYPERFHVSSYRK